MRTKRLLNRTKLSLLVFLFSALSINAITLTNGFLKEKPNFSMSNTFGAGDKKPPMGFEENKGQFIDEKGNYVEDYFYRFKTKDANIYLGKNGITYLLFKSAGEHKPHKKGVLAQDSVLFSRVDIDLLGASIKKENIIAENELVFFSNYYLSEKHIENVKQFQKLTFKNIYEGIDWVWYVNEKESGGLIKYDFIVHPNADPAQIKMLYKWADVSIENNNSVTIKTPMREVKEGAAVSFVNGKEIGTSYVLKDNVVSYDLKEYDHTQTLIIDPPLNLIWGTYFGGTAWEKNTDVSNAIDANGNVFVVGNTYSTGNIPLINPGGGAYFQGTYGGSASNIEGHGGDIVIFKFTNLGALIWCTYYGGTNDDNGVSITVDNNNSVYVAGCSLSSNFPLQNQAGSYNQSVYAGGVNTNNEGGDAVIMKFTNNGNLQWATYYGGSASEGARGVVTDAAGNVFMVGWTLSTNFPLNNPGGGTYYQGTNGGGRDAFVVKFNPAGAQVWSTYYGGNGNDIAHYITRDMATGMIFVGETESTNLPIQNPGGGAYFQAANAGQKDAFIVKINNAGVRSWGTYYGGSTDDIARGTNVSAGGAIYVIGQTFSTNFPLANPGSGAYYQPTKGGSAVTSDVFYIRFTNPGTQVWSTYYGGNNMDDGCAIVSDNCGHIYATGNTESTDLPLQDPGNGAFYIPTKLFSDDVWFASFTPLNGMLWSTYCGTDGFDEKGTSLKIDNNGNLFIVGYWCFYSNSNAYLAVTGSYNKTNVDADDFFIAKIQIASCSVNPFNFYLCYGSNTVITMPNLFNLTSPSYSIQPGSTVQASPNFTVSPAVNTTYTLYITGFNSSSVIVTHSTIANGTVYPAPVANPVVLNSTCTNTNNSVNIAVAFTPSGSANYTTSWSPLPANFSTVNSATASGLVLGPNSATITTEHGCKTVVNYSVSPIMQIADFIIINPSNDYTITCMNPNVLLTTSVTNGVPLTFVWSPCSPTVAGPSYNFTTQCTGIVVGTSSTGCNVGKTFTVYQNYTAPVIAITPSVMNINCSAAPGTFTGTSNLGPNVTTNWFQIVGTSTVYVGAAQGTINIFAPGQPGIYWFESVYNLTGCKTTQSVLVTASIGVPVFTVTSSTNFTIGCASTSITSLQITSVITSPVPNTPVNYTIMVPPVTSTPTTFSINPNLNGIIVPGTYVVYVKDITNNCISSQSISIIQNTIAPNIDFIQSLSILSCKDPSMVLNGISSNTNTSITWTVPATPSNSINPTPNHTVVINPAITGATNNITVVGIYTVGAINNHNKCVSSKTVQINQDVRLPKFTISALTNSVINCKNADVVIVPIVTPTLAVALVPTYVWYPPVGGVFPGTSYNTTAAGSHTSISTSVVNGCTYTATYIVASDFIPPPLSSTMFTLDCATNPSVGIFATVAGTTTGFTYLWAVPPGALTSNLTSSMLVTNLGGDYHVVVTNTLNGCETEIGIPVVNGSITANFNATPDFGFAPLQVTFNNLSATSTGASSIISTWGYGNGTVTQTVYNTSPTSASYTSSGTFSVILKVKKGNCVDTAMRTIIVDLPSKLEIPNVFTPNGDKANDVFRLIASNLNEIYIIIFDRWGTKVYELTSDTGNFGWDGKNLYGKDCSAGTYFYIIKATGKDGQEYDLKGNVSLFR